jgi:hypothetical protein
MEKTTMANLDAAQSTVTFGTNAVKFLQLLYPQGPWVLTAIVPDGRTTTATFTDPERAREFIAEHNNNGENVYYSINPTKRPLQSRRASRTLTRSSISMSMPTRVMMKAQRGRRRA